MYNWRRYGTSRIKCLATKTIVLIHPRSVRFPREGSHWVSRDRFRMGLIDARFHRAEAGATQPITVPQR
jgi:hypothetical protein